MSADNIDYTKFRTEKRVEKLRKVLENRQPTLTIVLENINDPHNVSAVFRTCDAVGVFEVCLIYYNGQKFPKLGAKSSASARKWVNQKHFENVEECYNYLKADNKKIYTTHLSSESVSLYHMDLTQPVALVFGNEHKGVSEEALILSDGNFLIPQTGVIQSLNISVACAVTLYEAYRQRSEKGMYESSQFNENDLKLNLNKWLKFR